MAVIRENIINFKKDELKHSIDTLKKSGFATYIRRSNDGKPFTVKCCHMRPPGASGHIAYACEVIAASVGLDPKKQVDYEPRKRITIYPALKSAIKEIFND